jgi:hypothetical protein
VRPLSSGLDVSASKVIFFINIIVIKTRRHGGRIIPTSLLASGCSVHCSSLKNVYLEETHNLQEAETENNIVEVYKILLIFCYVCVAFSLSRDTIVAVFFACEVKEREKQRKNNS